MPRTAAALLLVLVACGSASDPAPRREPARRSAPDTEQPLAIPEPPPSARSSFNRFSSPKRAAGKPAAVTAARAARPEVDLGSRACQNARSNALRMEAYVTSVEQEIEWLEDQADDIRDTSRSRGYYEGRLAAAEQQLEQAEDALADYVQSQRQQGLPPGCLR
jgi:hypothetical protein